MKSFFNKLMTVAAICTCAFAMVFNTAYAQSAIPNGSYQQSCQNVSVNSNTLSAECDTGDGSWIYTRLQNFPNCVSDISNMNGFLTCQPAGAPNGSYLQSCSQISTSGNNVYAMCKTGTGDWNRTSLGNFGSCSGDLANQYGSLTCPKGSAGSSNRPTVSFDLSSYTLTGSGFLTNQLVYFRVAIFGSSGFRYINAQAFSNSSGGIVRAPLYFSCYSGEKVGISANDNRWDSSRNDYLWSNVIEFWCQ